MTTPGSIVSWTPLVIVTLAVRFYGLFVGTQVVAELISLAKVTLWRTSKPKIVT